MDMKKPFLSVAVPTHQFEGNGYFFKRLMNSLWNQTFQDFEIVVTDNSDNDDIERICEWYRTGIRYMRNPNKGMAPNTNEAIRQSRGELIKILYMDDYLTHDLALENIVTAFEKYKGQWLVSACKHTTDGQSLYNTHIPHYSDNIQTGNNTIGSPSVLTVKRKTALLFDEKMQWLLDCDLYKRYHDQYGDPIILNSPDVVIEVHESQLTNTMGDDRKAQEYEYITHKYA